MATIKLKYRSSSVKGKDGSLFFQIIHQRQVRQVSTCLHVSDEEWNAEYASIIISPAACIDRKKYLLSVKVSLAESQEKLQSIISELDIKRMPYTACDIVKAYKASLEITGIVSFARRLIEEMTIIGKRSMVKRFEATLNSLLRYTDGCEVAWRNLTSTFVLGYEEFLIKRGLCRNSTSFYMRNLRAIVNRAVEQDYEVPRNPFRHVYMGVDKTVKRAVGLNVIRRIRDIDLTRHPSLDFARKVFMFAFYTRGMSFVDIAFLKKSDLNNGVITYSRRKTRQQLTVKVEPETRKLIDSFGKNESSYLLPILTDNMDDKQYENTYCRINRNIQKVGKMLGLETKLTLYVARHAWASIAHANNVALSTICKAMGHDSEKTTIIYLQSLDTASVDRANSSIIRMIDSRSRKR
ncbi:MAG: site-specific integrase [Muribaculaceae bacterium]|nr:site-specific integrase [Muribaculaceae bacterium]